jgi:hypothetical protein
MMLAMIRQLKDRLAQCECALITAGDGDSDRILDGIDFPKALDRTVAAARDARAHLDEAHKLIAEMRHNGDDDNDGDDDNELSFAGRSRRLDVLDRDDVGAAPRAQPPVRDVGGAFLAAQMREDEQRRLDAYYVARR